MKTYLAAAAALAAFSAPALAQGGPARAPSGCFIELQQLMAEPGGIDELGAAIRQVNDRLRPQVEEVRQLRRLADSLEQQQQFAIQSASRPVHGAPPSAEAAQTLSQVNDDLARVMSQLMDKRTQLRADYAEQMQATVGPVQQRLGQRALAFGSQHGCANLTVARAPDLPTLRSAGAQDMTRDFVAWYPGN